MNWNNGKGAMMTMMVRQRIMAMLVMAMLGMVAVLMLGGPAWSADQSNLADLDKFIRARIDIGEMMRSYFKDRGGMAFGEGNRPSPEQMRDMREDINARLAKVLAPYGLTAEEYRSRSREVLGDETAVQQYLDQHPDLKRRYEALPMDRMGRSGSGRGY
jgi:hypothetical protein